MAADNQLLDHPPARRAAKAKAREDRDYLAKLDKLAEAGGHGVDLSKMTDDEIRSRLLGR